MVKPNFSNKLFTTLGQIKKKLRIKIKSQFPRSMISNKRPAPPTESRRQRRF
jgi:hypothetical protein